MVFTLLVPSAIAQGPAWARVVSILQDAEASGARKSAAPHADRVGAGLPEPAAH
ncbi:hypothetical protein [Nocardia bovistercoris]|uniref:Uncharacterized protein n=1 Tax=Nocardia bovistercoris TaxID=2785916 RepID=A0A931IFN5_9NOCA|nr:hypothetical protein [Nocardia bovistercoris]MBH0779490.1 hypothetical protein [Nocardia bovistercoris]